MNSIINLKPVFAFLLLTNALALSSCKKILELDPAQSISNELALSSDVSVKQALTGCYDYFAVSALYGGEIMRNAELYAGEGELIWLGTFVGPREIFQRAILTTNFDVEDHWDNAYGAINSINNVLSALDVVEENDRARIEGEAKFLRGCIYFDLTRFFGQQFEAGQGNTQLAVPLVLKATENLEENASVYRNTVAECYSQVITDLTEAENLLPDENDVYATKYAAAAILSRVYLQMEDYASARDASDRVIGSGNYQLVANYPDEFGQDENTSEDIFAIQVSAQDGSNSMNLFFSTPSNGGRGDIQVEESFLDLFDDLDIRKSLYFKLASKWRCGKYNNEFGNVNLLRLAEMYLVRAECNARLGTSTGAAPLDDYNVIHTRAGLAPAIAVTLDDILLERRLELAQEGFKVHDVKRMHGVIGTMAYNDVKMVYPIPQREIEVNPNLQQNPGY